MDIDADGSRRLAAAARFFADRGVFGLVWIGRDLVVERTFGNMAGFVTVGLPIGETVFAFLGLESHIASFQDDPALSLELPGIVIVTGPETQARSNLSLFWDADQGCYVLLVARATLDATLELELVRHVRARLMAEADTNLKARELLHANRDLEQFAAIVSHDLKAPMRALQFLTEDVADMADRGDPAAIREGLALVRSQAQRMSSMLSGLLDYSSVGRKALAVEPVDTGQMARQIAESIPHGTGISVIVEGDWPMVDTLKAPLDLVLRNLVDNAVKHHDLERGKVWLECRDGADHLILTVSDDGPGIPQQHRAAIFLPFRTLAEPSRSSSGLGLGLALVQRTTESVGGRITLLSQDAARPGCAPLKSGRGASFEVRWPKMLGMNVLFA